jgi:hypothetical protein
MERKIFATDGPEYRATLIKWERDVVRIDQKRRVLLETTDPKQLEAALLMLISEAETQRRASNVSMSIIP